MAMPSRSRRPRRTYASPPADMVPHYLLVLDDLGDLGVRIAQEAAEICKETANSKEHITKTVACYCRASRGVRRAILLSHRIETPALTMDDMHRLFVRKRILREVEAAIDRAGYRPVDAEFLCQELLDKLDASEIDSAVFHLPIAEIIAAICRDLGIAMAIVDMPISDRGPRDLQALCVKATGQMPPRPPQASVTQLPRPAQE